MSTLRVSNIEAKAFPSSPSVDEKVKVTNSSGDILLHLDGTTSGIGSIGIGTTGTTFRVDPNNTVTFPGNVISSGIITASSLSGNLTGNVTGNVTGTVTQLETNATGANLTLTGNLGVGGTITYEDVARVDATGVSTFREGLKVGPLTGIALTAYTDGSIRSIGIITATSFSGSGTNLTSLPAAQLTGTLPAIDGSSLTGVGVGTADSINTSGIVTATAFIPTSGQLSNRNLIVNGAMQIAQRGTSAQSNGYKTLDRFSHYSNGGTITWSQVSETPGIPTHGCRYSMRITNTQNLGTNAYREITYKIENQDLMQCGWDYTSASSKLTLSFWVRASVAQTYYGRIRWMGDSADKNLVFSTGALTANTWKKVEVTIPGLNGKTVHDGGNSANNSSVFQINWSPFHGTDYTASGVALNTWNAYSGSDKYPDFTQTWASTQGSTFDITAIQLEVGSVATPYEHRTYGDELKRAQRYFFKLASGYPMFADRTTDAHNAGRVGFYWFNQAMRAAPSMSELSMTVYTGSAQTLQAYSVTTDWVWFNHTGSFSDGRAWCKINSFWADAEI